MPHLRHILLALLAATAPPAFATADVGYDLLVVACGSDPCRKIADRTLAGGRIAEMNHNGLHVQIEPTASRSDEVDARISLVFNPVEAVSGIGRAASAVRMSVESCTLKPGVFSSVAAFISAGTVYRVWARLAARR